MHRFYHFGTSILHAPIQRQPPYLVKLFIKLAELGNFLHDLLPHEERCVEHGVVLAVEDP